MGPEGLSALLPEPDHEYWSQLPAEADIAEARAVLGALTSHISTVHGIERPTGLPSGPEGVRWSNLFDSLDVTHCEPELLGATWEQLMARGDRRARGAHFTPPDVAVIIVDHAMSVISSVPKGPAPEVPTIWDPSVGGGVFLLAAARWLDAHGWGSRGDIVGALYGTDVDPVAVEVCATALELWGRAAGAAHLFIGDALLEHPDTWPEQFSMVVGNPPFLGQLTADTGRDVERRGLLALRFPSMTGGYIDECAIFLLLAAKRTVPGGALSLVLPESVLGARDARPVREAIDDIACMEMLWIDEAQSFDAAVDVVAPVFRIRSPDDDGEPLPTVLVGAKAAPREAPRRGRGMWSPLLASALGVPAVDVPEDRETLGSLVTVTAGFRQHFYGIAGAVTEKHPDREPSASQKQLITSGAIDPLEVRWGSRPVKFAGSRWHAPLLDIEQIEDRDVQLWYEQRAVPKLLLASQTRVLEAIVDESAAMAPSVPVLSVEPHSPGDLWRVAAVLTSPLASVWIGRQAAGTGLSQSAFRVRARDVMGLPLPDDDGAWDAGAEAARRAQEAAQAGRVDAHVDALRELAVSMSAAYGGVESSVTTWWWERLRLPAGTTFEAY